MCEGKGPMTLQDTQDRAEEVDYEFDLYAEPWNQSTSYHYAIAASQVDVLVLSDVVQAVMELHQPIESGVMGSGLPAYECSSCVSPQDNRRRADYPCDTVKVVLEKFGEHSG